MADLARRGSYFNDLFDFRRDFDDIFNRFLTSWPGRSQSRSGSSELTLLPAVNAYVDNSDKKFHCQVSLPGVDPKDVNIQIQGRSLSIRGESEMKKETKDADFVHREMIYGSFERHIELPEGIDPDKISAEYRNGILEITAPITAAALPRRIEIKQGEAAKQIAAGR